MSKSTSSITSLAGTGLIALTAFITNPACAMPQKTQADALTQTTTPSTTEADKNKTDNQPENKLIELNSYNAQGLTYLSNYLTDRTKNAQDLNRALEALKKAYALSNGNKLALINSYEKNITLLNLDLARTQELAKLLTPENSAPSNDRDKEMIFTTLYGVVCGVDEEGSLSNLECVWEAGGC